MEHSMECSSCAVVLTPKAQQWSARFDVVVMLPLFASDTNSMFACSSDITVGASGVVILSQLLSYYHGAN
jgi:hypothetical protein